MAGPILRAGEPRSHTAARSGGAFRGAAGRLGMKHGWLAATLLILLCSTRGIYFGDTSSYTGDIAQYVGRSPIGAGSLLWEFGHLFWRPIGWGLVTAGAPVFARLTDWGPVQAGAFVLMGLTILCGVLTVLLWHSLALDLTASRAVAFLIAFSFACSNSFLTYVHAGASYVCGLFAVTLSIWVLRNGRGDGPIRPAALVASAALAAFAAMLWFPYVLSAPGIVFIALWPTAATFHPASVLRPENIRLMRRFVVVLLICLALGFGAGAWARRITSISQARTWIAESGHGWSQTHRIARLATGLPRSFFFMGSDGILYKRFLLKDPYAPVGIRDLMRASLWKILIFDIFLLSLIYALLRSPGHWAFWALLAGSVPVLAFAVFLFEPGSPERFFPAYPFLILAVAWALRDFPRARRMPQFVILAFLTCMAATNIYSMYRPRVDRMDAGSIGRLADVRSRVSDTSLVAILNNLDELEGLTGRAPFSAVNRPAPRRLYDVIEPNTLRIPTWRREFAQEALRAWSNGGEVWVSKRLLQDRPRPEWNWVEGDDKRITWKDVPAFFLPLLRDDEFGGPDGFARLEHGDANVTRLASFVR